MAGGCRNNFSVRARVEQRKEKYMEQIQKRQVNRGGQAKEGDLGSALRNTVQRLIYQPLS